MMPRIEWHSPSWARVMSKVSQHRSLKILAHIDHGVNGSAANNQEQELQVALFQAGLSWVSFLMICG